MYRFLARTILIAALILLVGCQGGGNPGTPDLGNPQNPADQSSELTGTTNPTVDNGDLGRILGNFYYTPENEELLAWGTLFVSEEGWDYRLDYVAPKLIALQRSDPTRNAQCTVDLTWLKAVLSKDVPWG